ENDWYEISVVRLRDLILRTIRVRFFINILCWAEELDPREESYFEMRFEDSIFRSSLVKFYDRMFYSEMRAERVSIFSDVSRCHEMVACVSFKMKAEDFDLSNA
ncbi:16038_t:CDS:2, partial [Acaulospora morrowiae]